MKTLFILVGPKGASKTHIGTLVNAQMAIKFLPVEPIWIDYLKNGAEIDRLFESNNKVMIESLGAGEGFAWLHKSLKNKYQIKFIKVESALDKCLERVRNRESTTHIPISADKVEEYNKIAAQVSYNWNLVIDNNSPASDLEIIQAIQAIE